MSKHVEALFPVDMRDGGGGFSESGLSFCGLFPGVQAVSLLLLPPPLLPLLPQSAGSLWSSAGRVSDLFYLLLAPLMQNNVHLQVREKEPEGFQKRHSAFQRDELNPLKPSEFIEIHRHEVIRNKSCCSSVLKCSSILALLVGRVFQLCLGDLLSGPSPDVSHHAEVSLCARPQRPGLDPSLQPSRVAPPVLVFLTAARVCVCVE